MNKVSAESKTLRNHLLRFRRKNKLRNVIQERGTGKSVLALVNIETDLLADNFLKRIENGEPLTFEMWEMARFELATRIWNSFYGGN